MKFQRHTLHQQLGQQCRSYAGSIVPVLQGLDGRLSLLCEERTVSTQEVPPSPGSLRHGVEPVVGDAILSPDPVGLYQIEVTDDIICNYKNVIIKGACVRLTWDPLKERRKPIQAWDHIRDGEASFLRSAVRVD